MIRVSLVCVLLTIALAAGQEQDNLVNTNVERALDLVSHIPRETISVTIENRGSKVTRHYDYIVEPQHISNVAFVGASVGQLAMLTLGATFASAVGERKKQR